MNNKVKKLITLSVSLILMLYTLALVALLITTPTQFITQNALAKSNADAPEEAASELSTEEGTTEETTETETETETAVEAVVDDGSMTATDFINNVTIGINIGNSLDSYPTSGRNDGTKQTSYYETFWGNPVITEQLVASIHDAGFDTVRIPVTWYFNTYEDEDGKLAVREEWFERVAEVVNYALNLDMYVILDSHHDELLMWADSSDAEIVEENVRELWTVVGDYFKDYDEKLVFEGFNELNNKNNSWTYSKEYTATNNNLNQIFVDTVRSTGGKNTSRVLICSTFLNDTSDNVLSDFVLPTDSVNDRLVISVHIYDSSYGHNLNNQFKKLQEFSEKNGAPVIIDEFGTTTDFNPIENRAAHAGNFVACAAKYNLKCVWWDNGSEYSLFNRKDGSITEQEIVDALMNPVETN